MVYMMLIMEKIFAPDDSLLEQQNSILEARMTDDGSHTRIGRHYGRNLHEAGFVDVKASENGIALATV